MMAVSDFVSIPLWLVSVVGALFLIVFVLFYGIKNKRSYRYLGNSFLRLPYPVIPFILSMFVLVLSLKDAGVIKIIANYLSNINPYLGVGLISFIGADFLNNIPMSVFFTEVISSMSTYNSLNVYLAIIASNIGAYLTPVGALAGVMWMSILKNHEIKFGFLDFIKYLSPISIISLAFCFLGIILS
jgi:arsenical pump membrane protein